MNAAQLDALRSDEAPLISPAQLDLALKMERAWIEALEDARATGNGFIQVTHTITADPLPVEHVEIERLDPEHVVLRQINPVLTAPEIHDERSPR